VGCGGTVAVLAALTGRIDVAARARALRSRMDAAREAEEPPERIRLGAGSVTVVSESVTRVLGVFVVLAGASAGAGGVPKRLSRSLWNLRFVVASASGIVRV